MILYYSFENIEYAITQIKRKNIILFILDTYNYRILKEAKDYLKEEQKKASEKYKSKMAKINYIVSRGIINKIYREILNCNIEDIRILRDENNKPYIVNSDNIKFNISHTNGIVLVGLSLYKIGVDIERINRDFQYKDILSSCFNNKEINYINGDIHAFFELWTAKEAYLKCQGVGLVRDMKEIEIIYSNENSVTIRDNLNKNIAVIEKFTILNKYIGMVCFMEEI